jgi:23S rRNA (pseudouridine1915-N3)-methyltransferase
VTAALRLLLVTASNRQPEWIDAGYAEYAHRLRGRCTLELKTIPLAKRTASASANVGRALVERAMADEGARMTAAIPDGAHVVALVENGKPWSTKELAAKLARWAERGAPVIFLVGGPDGLGAEALARATDRWSLSPLTLPHGLVRVVVAEALYRAWSTLQNHPYHRG